jgi:hypothetical protein
MKYLTYVPWPGGLNNTRMCFETVLLLAYLSRRCLVLPKEYRRHNDPESEAGRFRPLYPEEYFDLRALREVVPMLDHEDYERTVFQEENDACVVDLVFEPQTSVFCFPRIPDSSSPSTERLIRFAAARRRFLEFTPEMNAARVLHVKNPTFEHFYTFICCLQPADDLACKRLIKSYVKFRPEIEIAARAIAASLGRYAAVHVRRGDFFNLSREQNIPAPRLIENLVRQVPLGMRLYIASDEKDRAFFNSFRQHYEIYFIDDFRLKFSRNLSDASIACVEQLICAFGETFIGTKLSTFSGYITRLRGYNRTDDTSIRFTDGSPGSEMDSSGSPLFSWANWVDAGHPQWGREFKESWEFESIHLS